jgi:hypothetical protein
MVFSSMVCIFQPSHEIPIILLFTMRETLNFAFEKKIAIIASHTNKQITYWIKWTIHTMLKNTYHAGQYIKASSHVFVARFIDFASLYDFDI